MRLDVSWWPRETVYFDSSRALACLWDCLPDGNVLAKAARVTHVVRRVYVDGMALLRFEIAIYPNCESRGQPIKMGLEQCSKRFLEERSFKLNHDDNADNSSLIECVGKLVERFEQATMTKESVELASSLLSKPFCRQLDPELQVLVEAKDNELNDTYELIDSCAPIHLRFASARLHGLAIPTVYIAYPKDFIRDRDSEEMKKLRLIRRAIRWLHTNLEILTHILQESVRQTVEPSAIEEYVQTLAEGLWRAPQQAKPQPRIVELLMNTLDSYHENSISRLVDL